MGISLLTGVEAAFIQRQLDQQTERGARSLERLVTGRRIVRVGDDPSGEALADGYEARARSYAQARRDAADALSVVQVAEGGLNEAANLALRLRKLATAAASDDVNDRERGWISKEADALSTDLSRLSSMQYLGVPLLNGSGRTLEFQIGIDQSPESRVTYAPSETDIRPDSLGIGNTDFSDSDRARDAMVAIDEGIARINDSRASLGAIQTTLQFAMDTLSMQEDNARLAVSRIRDVDVAKETTEWLSAGLRQRAAIAVLAQANQFPLAVLRLLDPVK